MGRATQGVRLINIKGNDSIAAVTKVMKEDEAEEVDGEILEEGLDGEVGTAEDATEVQE
jgi:DNA gyrase subunit A